jgi:hypothetical protein
MATYIVTVSVREKAVIGVITRLKLPSENFSEKRRLENTVGSAVGGTAELMRDRYINAIRLFSRDEVELEIRVNSTFSKDEVRVMVEQAVVQYWGGVVDVFDSKIVEQNILENVVGKTDIRGAVAAFAGSFMIGAVLGIVVKLFRG